MNSGSTAFDDLIVSLRNDCCNLDETQLKKLWTKNYQEVWKHFFYSAKKIKIDSREIIILQRIYQYLANVLTCIDVREFFNDQFFKISKQFIALFNPKFQKIKNYSIATLFNYYFNNYSDANVVDNGLVEFVELVLYHLDDVTEKYRFIEKLLVHQKFYAIYPSLNIFIRINIVVITCEAIKADDNFTNDFTQFIILLLIDCKNISPDIIIQFEMLQQDNFDSGPLAYFKNMIECLINLSAKHHFESWDNLSALLWIPDLLKKLCYAHNMESATTSIKKLEIIDCMKDDKENQKKQLYNIKNVLVRLIGNVVFNNDLIKKEFTDAGVVQALMQCSQLDPLNPYIRECSIFAIRNICQDNKPAQDIIDATLKINP